MICRRLGDRTIAVCDVDLVARKRYTTHHNGVTMHESVVAMGSEEKALRKAHLITCGYTRARRDIVAERS